MSQKLQFRGREGSPVARYVAGTYLYVHLRRMVRSTYVRSGPSCVPFGTYISNVYIRIFKSQRNVYLGNWSNNYHSNEKKLDCKLCAFTKFLFSPSMPRFKNLATYVYINVTYIYVRMRRIYTFLNIRIFRVHIRKIRRRHKYTYNIRILLLGMRRKCT